MSAEKSLAVLVSGNGSNLQALIDARSQGRLSATIALVISNRPGAFALRRAEQAGIPSLTLAPKDFASREDFDAALLKALKDVNPSGVVLAGFDRILSQTFIRAYPSRIFNIHPSLLPAFPGLHAVRQALAYGVKTTGVTVHLVDEGLDTGPIVAQRSLPVLADDMESTLTEKIHALEHALYPEALEAFVTGRLRIDGRQVRIL